MIATTDRTTADIRRGDCLVLLPQVAASTVDLTFLDPPFNQQKDYALHNDAMSPDEYWQMIRDGDALVVERDANGQPRHRGSGKDLSYYDDLTKERFVPHVIEPSAGADRATLAFICEAYHVDTAPTEKGEDAERVVMRFHPRLAPIKVAVFPLVKKDGMPEMAAQLYGELKKNVSAFYDDKGAVGRRYRHQDEIGTPYCVTIDGESLQNETVTIRDRDTLLQTRVNASEVTKFILEKTT